MDCILQVRKHQKRKPVMSLTPHAGSCLHSSYKTLSMDVSGSRLCRVFSTHFATDGSGAHKKTFPGGAHWSAAVAATEGRGPTVIALVGRVAASEGQCLGSCPRSVKISMSSQDDLDQRPACSASAMDP